MNVISTFITFICILICINSTNSQENNEDTPRENSKTKNSDIPIRDLDSQYPSPFSLCIHYKWT